MKKGTKIIYRIGKLSEKEQFQFDFEDGLSRNVEERIRLGFISMKLPVMDDLPFRIFNTMEDYRRWAGENLPSWLGYCQEDD